MILQALKEYYDRKAANPESGIAPIGWGWQSIPFIINLSLGGNFLGIEDTRIDKRAKRFLVPILGESKGNGCKSNFPWENAEYIFGVPLKEDKNNSVAKKHEQFITRVKEYCTDECCTHEWARAILAFLKNVEVDDIVARFNGEWKDVEKGAYLIFAINGVPVCELDDFKASYHRKSESTSGVCLVTGIRDVLKKKEPSIRGRGFFRTSPNQNIKAELHLVSFNEVAFTSFRKEQGENSPIGEVASYSYTAALNHLLSEDSKQKVSIGDTTAVFWSKRNDEFESAVSGFLSDMVDDPDQYVENVRALLESPRVGVGSFSDDLTEFYVLGMMPNSSRIAVRFWYFGTVSQLSGRFREYFTDLLLCHGPNEKEHLSMQRLLLSLAVRGKAENIIPNLAGDFMRSILEGRSFPGTILQAALRRIRSESKIKSTKDGSSYACVKLIKGFLNRKWRYSNPNQERNLTMSLDFENKNIGYRLGRLFAVLERIQMAANPGINTTIRDRFYASASARPSSVFSTLTRLANAHLSKVKKTRYSYWVSLNRLIDEVMSGIKTFPAHLTLDDQGAFAVGYHHQRYDLFPKKNVE